MASPLATLADLKVALGIPEGDVADDEKYEFALLASSEAIRRYTDRSWEQQEEAPEASSRDFEYDGSGWLEVDDCTSVVSVTINERVLTEDEWSAHPFNGPTLHYLTLERGFPSVSPAMGFRRNLDRYPYPTVTPTVASVEALWGWEEFPEDVKQAAIWTAVAMTENPRPYITESIEGYSRTRFAPDFVIPPRAEALLDPYIRVKP